MFGKSSAESSAPSVRHISPAAMLILGFLGLILAGAVLLSLPVSSASGGGLPFFKSLFTATSAVCVTGLIVVDTATQFSFFGQAVLLLLIQLGGLGFMTAAMLLFFLMGKRISLRNRLAIQEALNQDTLQGLVRLMLRTVVLTLAIEFIGALLLMGRFVPQFGARGVWMGIFHGISAFCNAGFDLMGNFSSLTAYVGDAYVSLVICALIILGGLGFLVIFDLGKFRQTRRLSLHSKITLTTTAFLLIMGTLVIYISDYNNPATLGSLGPGDSLLAAFFQSVTARTAGFNTIDQSALHSATQLITMILMFFGASSGSTGGGLKTSTLFVLCLAVRSVLRGRQDLECFGRRLPSGLMRKSLAIVCVFLLLIFSFTALISIIETYMQNDLPLTDIAYEVVSAFATVGVSTGITASLHPLSQTLLIIAMFAGRVGPLSLVMVLSRPEKITVKTRFPEENIMIG
jgi:trk system potassium uptake protein TrkH